MYATNKIASKYRYTDKPTTILVRDYIPLQPLLKAGKTDTKTKLYTILGQIGFNLI